MLVKYRNLVWYLCAPVNFSWQVTSIMVVKLVIVLLLQGRWHLHSIELLDKLSICQVSKPVYSNRKCVQASLMLSIVLLDKFEVFCKDSFPCIMLFGRENRVSFIVQLNLMYQQS